MAKPKKLIPCRVCGKMFEPCSYCQQHTDTFRWRNFACSLECAELYVTNVQAYRESQRGKAKQAETTPKKRGRKKSDVITEEVAESNKVLDGTSVVEDESVVETGVNVEEEKDTVGEVVDEIATDTGIEEI